MDPLTDKQAIRNLRQDYQAARLELTDTDPDPLRQFDRWLQEAIAADLPEPNAMILATADPAGRPSARVVLLKGLGPEG
ncbi:MAG: pyridoxamine 5'-phosphate oxidase family protein, partial [Saprospiraceae bacterium]|nr:pyridoxamine 5'-phosphate oxidase family protein [Saprospiraceae bacterium]